MTEQLPIDWQARRDQGIASSAQHAEQDVPGWGVYAILALDNWLDFLKFNELKGSWTMEECRSFCHEQGLREPPDMRAWGSVTQKAIRQGIIRKTGQYAPAASSNGSLKPLYVGCV